MEYSAGSYDVAVIGAGHAGIEAALAAARLGAKTILFTMNLDAVGNMPCNPSIGGTGKGQLVREIDALGGEMGRAADHTCLQSRMLNLGKGPAVHSLRMQADRRRYHEYMKKTIEACPHLDLKQAEIVEVRAEGGAVSAVVTRLGAVFQVKAVIIASGTYLMGKIFVGDVSYPGGPDSMFPAEGLSDSLRALGIELRRFKTGTPPRVHRRSIDFSRMEEQPGDEPPQRFSYDEDVEIVNKAPCHIAWTNGETHGVIRDNIGRSPLYGGKIHGIGPRYCPSIEDKVVRFSDKPRHQLFIEPCGEDTDEMYLQGMSSSLPEDVQLAFLRTISGLEEVKMMRTAYAIEYDCCNPQDLQLSLEFKAVDGLFGAGQFNGTSGYEEAAAQGMVAGINAAHRILGREPLILDRASSYIGALIDDIVTKGVNDPYRIMTSRSEYRLVLRHDNADDRLMETGHRLGLVSDARWERYLKRRQAREQELERIAKTVVSPGEGINALLVSRETSPIATGVRLIDLLRRPELSYDDLAPFDPERPELERDIITKVEIEIKYEGYIKKQMADIRQMRRLEEKALPEDLDYQAIEGIRLEAREKLSRVRPRSVGQASRISGVSPADIGVLLVFLAKRNSGRE